MPIAVGGLEDLDRAITDTVQVLTAPATAQAATQLVAAAGRRLVPRDTGKLAASESVTPTATGAQLVYAARYAPIVQASQPWLGAAITAALPALVELYGTAAADAWNT